MKWFVVAVVLAVIPLLIVWTRAQPRLLPWVWGLVAFLPFVTDYLHLYFAVASWAGWPGHTKGVELTLIDFLVLMLFLSDRQPNRRFAFIWPMAAYAGVVLLSVMQSLQAQPVIFYFWQLLRMLLLAIAVARASQNPGVVPGILWGLAAGIFLEAAMTPLQHGSGDLQTTGTFVHQNLLGLMSNSIAMIFFAVFMAKPNLKCLAVVVAAALIAVLTASRATQGLFIAGISLILLAGLIRRFSMRTLTVILLCVVAAGMAAPLALSTLQQRFAHSDISGDYDERAAFIKAASHMIADYPMGVGSNYYVLIANTKGYNEAAEVAPVAGSLSAHVHNVYYLVTAETGYLGLAAFVWMLLAPLIRALRWGWPGGDIRNDLVLGLGVGLFLTICHSFFEWILVTFSAQYILFMSVGLVAGLTQSLAEEAAWARRPRPIAPVLAPA